MNLPKSDWTEWDGDVHHASDLPRGVSLKAMVDVEFRNGALHHNRPAEDYNWHHNFKWLSPEVEIVKWRFSEMSTITPPCEPHKDGHTLLPMWLVSVFAKEDQAFGETYYVRAATPQLGVIRALALHPNAFEKVTCESVADGGGEVGHGLDNG